MNIIEIDIKDIRTHTTTHKHKTHTSKTLDISHIISNINKHEDIVAWQTKRKINPRKTSHKLINSKLYDLNKLSKSLTKRIKNPTITQIEIKQIKAEIKHSRLNKPDNKKQPSEITDKDYYTPLIHTFLSSNKGKAYTYDSIAKNINYNIIDREDKKYFISIITSIKKLKHKDYEGSRYYWKL